MFRFFFFVMDVSVTPKADVYLCTTGTRMYAFKPCVQPDLRRDKEFDLLSIRLGKFTLKVITDNPCSSTED